MKSLSMLKFINGLLASKRLIRKVINFSKSQLWLKPSPSRIACTFKHLFEGFNGLVFRACPSAGFSLKLKLSSDIIGYSVDSN